MAIAMKIASHISKSSWIRRMFEEGERLRQEVGDYHATYPLRRGMPREELKSRLKLKSPVPGKGAGPALSDGDRRRGCS